LEGREGNESVEGVVRDMEMTVMGCGIGVVRDMGFDCAGLWYWRCEGHGI